MISDFWFNKYNLNYNLFIKTPYKFQFITKNLSNVISSNTLKDNKNWHLMWIDSDDL